MEMDGNGQPMGGNPADMPGDSAKNTENNLGKVFVGGLAPTTNGDALKSYFNQKYGSSVKDAYVNTTKDEYTGQIRSRGFGFVIFENPNSVDEVVQLSMSSDIVIDGRKVEVKRVDENEQQRKAEIEARQVFVGGLPESCTNEMLLNCFKGIDANVQDAKVRMDPFTNRSRGFGYVTFSDKSFVDVAVAQRDNHYIDGKWVDVKACIPMHKDHKIARANNFAQNKQMNMMGKTGGMKGKGGGGGGKMGGGMKGGNPMMGMNPMMGNPMMGMKGMKGGPMGMNPMMGGGMKGGWGGPQMGYGGPQMGGPQMGGMGVPGGPMGGNGYGAPQMGGHPMGGMAGAPGQQMGGMPGGHPMGGQMGNPMGGHPMGGMGGNPGMGY